MIRRCPRNHTVESASQSSSFSLFKPLITVASLTIMFELLPMDFQNWIAPSLVSSDEVFWAGANAPVCPQNNQQIVFMSLESDYSDNEYGTSL